MSNLVVVEDNINMLESDFNEVNSYKMNFKKESMFAMQLLRNNDFLLSTAIKKPSSLEQALMNIAAVGITLNPALKEAYLVPRGGQVCLDISYIGLVKLATDTGSVEWAQVEIVKANDKFEFRGIGTKPDHAYNPFTERGAMVGAYCVAKLSTGDFLTTIMTKAEIEYIRDKSSQAKSGPWNTFFEEMAKKTVVKRAVKLWPKSERVAKAVDVLNEHEGIDFTPESKKAFIPQASEVHEQDDATFENIRNLLKAKGKDEKGLLNYINTQFSSEIETIEEMSVEMIEASYRVMGGRK